MSKAAALLKRIEAMERRIAARAQTKAQRIVLCNQAGELLPSQELLDLSLNYLKRIVLTHQVVYE